MTTRDDNEQTPSIVEIEVPGTPEQVWDAIATGPGIGAWFVPAEVVGGEGGSITMHFGEGQDSTGSITGWEPPRRFAYAERWQPGEGEERDFATEFLVEARGGGTCVVRIVSSGFGEGPDWEQARRDLEGGWHAFLGVLRLYLTHFAGERSTTVAVKGRAAGPVDRAWAAFVEALGLRDARVGERVATASSSPRLAGVVERAKDDGLVLRVDEPAPGIVLVGAYASEGEIIPMLSAYLYGEAGRAAAEQFEPAWRGWMAERFPSAQAGAA